MMREISRNVNAELLFLELNARDSFCSWGPHSPPQGRKFSRRQKGACLSTQRALTLTPGFPVRIKMRRKLTPPSRLWKAEVRAGMFRRTILTRNLARRVCIKGRLGAAWLQAERVRYAVRFRPFLASSVNNVREDLSGQRTKTNGYNKV